MEKALKAEVAAAEEAAAAVKAETETLKADLEAAKEEVSIEGRALPTVRFTILSVTIPQP